jgi:hypothetical protein
MIDLRMFFPAAPAALLTLVDRLRDAPGKIILESPEFQRLLNEAGAKIVPLPTTAVPVNSPAAQ